MLRKICNTELIENQYKLLRKLCNKTKNESCKVQTDNKKSLTQIQW